MFHYAENSNFTIVLLCYARSGGTLFSRAIGSLPDTVLVSEVNPCLNAKGTIATQLSAWYGIQIPEKPFAEMAFQAHEACLAAGKQFVIRDFTFIDFTPHTLNQFRPANDFSSLLALKDCLPIKPVAFVRDAFDVWISRNCPPQFSAGYLHYVKALLAYKIPIFRYEDFCETPVDTMNAFCRTTGLPFNQNFLVGATANQKITGDVDLKNPSRGNLHNAIVSLKRKILPRFLARRAMADHQLAEANGLLGYSSDFLDAEFEDEPSRFSLEMKWYLKRLLKTYPTDLY